METSTQENSKIHLNPSPDEADYYDQVMKNAAEDREGGESNPNYKDNDKSNDLVH